ncbi:class I SAM-dependent methyltransferase [Spirosoma sp.]|uniref:class I SAM-dependent methyltransferase n=1 Tax=Spirosoma sp. TaxID=1899569 RepID=UPI003B3A4677
MSLPNAIDFHDSIAAQFDRKYELSAAFQERFQVWINLFGQYVAQTDRVLDFGCGSGIFSNYLARKGCQVIGLDGSAAMITLANQKRKSANVHYVLQALPLIDLAAYKLQNVIIMSSLLEYVNSMEQLLQQTHTLLKPNGHLIVSIPNSVSIYRRLERILFWLTGLPVYVGHVRNRSTEEAFGKTLTDVGFEVLETIYFSGHDPISRMLKPFLPQRYVNNLFVVVCRKKTC